MPYLEVNLGSDTLLLPFAGRIDYVFGRLPRADVQLRDMKISRLHIQIFNDSRGKAYVRDLGSSGGTILNGAKLPKEAIANLASGARIRVGDARIIYHAGAPTVPPPKPPSTSAPRGMVRTNTRKRPLPPALPAAKIAIGDTGPAEAPPEVIAADFASEPTSPPPPPPEGEIVAAQSKGDTSRVPGKRKDTGIVEAPWEAAESNRHQAVMGEKRVTLSPTTRVSPPVMPSAEIDETGKFHEAQPQRGTAFKPVPPIPPRTLGTPAEPPRTSRLTAPEPDFEASAAAFVPPPPPAPPPPPPVDDEAPRVGMPTVRLDKAQIKARQAEFDDTTGPPASIGSSADVPAGLDDLRAVDFGDEGNGAGESDPGEQVAFSDHVKAVTGDNLDYDLDTPPPPAAARSGATPDQGFARPQKTRKLMKRRTDKLAEPAPVADPGATSVGDELPEGGAKTVFIPKPDSFSTRTPPPVMPDSPTRRLEKLGRGPGGDTLPIPPDLLQELRSRQGGAGTPEVVIEDGDSLTDSSAMLTPPPIEATRPRKPKTKIVKPTDFMTDPPLRPGKTPPPSTGGETRVD